MSVTLLLEDDLDLSRGDMIVRENNHRKVSQDMESMVLVPRAPLQLRGKYTIQHTTQRPLRHPGDPLQARHQQPAPQYGGSEHR